MLNRDFTKSNKVYFKQNKIVLGVIAVFLIIGLVFGLAFGFRGNYEVAGYNEYSVTIGSEVDVSDYTQKLTNLSNAQNANVDSVLVFGKGDDTKLVVRYLNDLTTEEQNQLNANIVQELNVDAEDVSAHIVVGSVLKNTDYIYAITAILILLVVASGFAYFRYNGASALTLVISCLVATACELSFTTILRLTVSLTYMPMIVLLNAIVALICLSIFESIKKANWLNNGDYLSAITNANKDNHFKLMFITISIFVLGFAFVIFAPSAIKYISTNLLFMAVVILAVGLYIIPFFWSVFITFCKRKNVVAKTEVVKENADIEK